MHTRPLGKAPKPRPINPVLSGTTLVCRGFLHQCHRGPKDLLFKSSWPALLLTRHGQATLPSANSGHNGVAERRGEVAGLLSASTSKCTPPQPSPLQPLVMWHAGTTLDYSLGFGAFSQSALTREWIKTCDEQLRASSSYQAPPSRGGDPRHISTHYTIRIPSMVKPSHKVP